MSLNPAAVVLVTLLSSFYPGSGFIRVPSVSPQQQAIPFRRRATTAALSFSTTPRGASTASVDAGVAGSASGRTITNRGGVAPLRVGGITFENFGDPDAEEVATDNFDPLADEPDIDPLEAGPDLQEDVPAMTLETPCDEEEVAKLAKREKAVGLDVRIAEVENLAGLKPRGRVRKIVEPKVPSKWTHTDSIDVLDAMRAKGGKPRRKRRRADPFFPKNHPRPIEWMQTAELEEGCRGVFIICHRGLEEDMDLAAKLFALVKDRFGPVVATHEMILEHERMTEEQLIDSNAFEIWLEGCESIAYHLRATTGLELTDEMIQNILKDMDTRLCDEAILILDTSRMPLFDMPGYPMEDAIFRANQFL